jgi:hypothetical protein
MDKGEGRAPGDAESRFLAFPADSPLPDAICTRNLFHTKTKAETRQALDYSTKCFDINNILKPVAKVSFARIPQTSDKPAGSPSLYSYHCALLIKRVGF